jgi:peptide/nickel transport system permease protein
MGTYIIRRLLWVFVLLFCVLSLTFVIFSVFPSADPASLRAGRQPSPELVEQIRKNLGLDKPKPEQFYNHVKDLSPFWIDFKGFSGLPDPDLKSPDLGYSYQNDASVKSQIFDRLPATISLTVGAAILWLLVGLTVGVISAIRRRSPLDRVAMGGALLGISAPVYWLGLVALYLFAKDVGQVQIFPGSGSYEPLTDNPGAWLSALILPWMVLATLYAANYARLLRGNLIEVMSEDYIRTARAKGLTERRVVFRHGVRSAITPIVTLLGLDVGQLLGGAILTESVFNIPGVGRLAFGAIERNDLPMIQGTVLFAAFFVVMANLIVDVVYAFLDPRVRYT